MANKNLGKHTVCVHTGEVEDKQYKGAVSPIYVASAYGYIDEGDLRYPRAFNSPNQLGVAKKIAVLEQAEAGLVFGSGMAGLSAIFLTFLKAGDHLVVQNTLYGGAVNFIKEEFPKYDIEYTFTEGYAVSDFEKAIQPNTKLIHIETPSNPLLTITGLKGVAQLAKQHGLLTSIDNTFASPINQNPIAFGIDIVMHSATKYLGGHSDILAGAVAGSQEHIDQILHTGKNFGGNLSDYTVWLLERSLKTLGLRVKAQNRNAKKIAKWLEKHEAVKAVHYPGLKSHPHYALAKSQMTGYGGMLSFELKAGLDAVTFLKALKLIKPAVSLAGVESTIVLPAKTSHVLLTPEERKTVGISDNVIRFSAGIENRQDLIADFGQAFERVQ